MGLFAAVDKVQFATEALYGFKEGNNLQGQDYIWLGSILSLGMLVGIWPSTYLIHRLPAGKYLSAFSMCWSLMTLCIAACHNWAGLMVLRFLMGVFEAIINRDATLLISVFWKKSEQPIRNGIIMTVFSSVVNGLLSWVIGKIPSDAPLARW
uniref:Major facilitator superfamily (MFS) profile domain-containing protein n=1 Tax=Bionectria ochroleuca TaxID=29856 RepID=A0A8H7TWQ0_BIOOC